MTFGAALTAWRTKAGWSYERIAKTTGLHRDTVRALCKDWHAPQRRTFWLLCEKCPGLKVRVRDAAPEVLAKYERA